MRYFLNTYTPLIAYPAGRAAAVKHNLPPYIDGSCRREPDLESAFPSITAVCRGRIFVPRLAKGDTIVYMTKKGSYSPHRSPHWRLVAILHVREMMPTHADAAKWYQAQGLPLPSNCLVEGNPPVQLDKTAVASDPDKSDAAVIRDWDKGYQDRVKVTARFIICKSLFCELHNPPVVMKSDLHAIFGPKTPNTRIPPRIQPHHFSALRQLAFSGRSAAPRGQQQLSHMGSGMRTAPKCLPQTRRLSVPTVTVCGGRSKGKK